MVFNCNLLRRFKNCGSAKIFARQMWHLFLGLVLWPSCKHRFESTLVYRNSLLKQPVFGVEAVKVPLGEPLLLQETLEQSSGINCGSRVALGLNVYKAKHQVSHVRQIQNQTVSLCLWPARPPQIAEGVAFSNKLCSFEFGICSQSGFCEASIL